MKHKSPNKSQKKDNLLSQRTPKRRDETPKLYPDKNKRLKDQLQLSDYLYSFPTCDQGSPGIIYLDEIVVYYSFN